MTLASPSTALRGAAATAAHATLTPHLMLDPPLPRRGRDDAAQGGLFDVDVGTVWKTARAAEGGDTLLTVRCFSVEGLQLRLAQLVNGHAGMLSPSLAMFLRGGLDQAYVDAGWSTPPRACSAISEPIRCTWTRCRGGWWSTPRAASSRRPRA